MKYIFILNSFGKKDVNEIATKIKLACNSLDINYVIEINGKNISTDDIIKKYKDSHNILFAVGGDGMINRTLNSIVGTNNILGYIPYGTGNDFDRAVKETLTSGFNDIDLIKINDKYFINVACFGVDADIANDDKIIHNKFIPNKERYNVSVLYHFLKYKGRKLEVLIDNEIIKDELATLVVANGAYYGGGYKIAPSSLIDDGLLNIYLLKKLPKLKMAELILKTKDGAHESDSNVTKFMTNKLKVKSEIPFSCNIDGESLTSDNFDIELIHKGITLYNNQELIRKVLKK